MFESKFIDFQNSSGGIDICGVPVVIDESDYTGIRIAALSLSQDMEKVTGKRTQILQHAECSGIRAAIILGSLQKSALIKSIVEAKKIDVAGTESKWEAFVTCLVDDPIQGIEKALVLTGSDKRGTMFAAYTLCGQIGVSP